MDLFVASWDRGPAVPWVARHGLSSDDYQRAFDAFTKQGFRLRNVSGYESSGQPRYAAIWDKRAGGAWVARHGMTSAQYQQEFDRQMAAGLRLRMVNGYGVGGRDLYAAFWEKADGPAWAARHGHDSASYQQAFDHFVGAGFRPIWVSVYQVGGRDFYAAIWEKSPGPAWVARHGQSQQQFSDTHDSLASKGYDLVCGGAANVGGRDLYAGLWQLAPVASQAHHGMTHQGYQAWFDRLVREGFQPRFVTGWAGVDAVDVRLNFEMQRQTQSNWCWAATAASVSRFYDPASTWTQCRIANGQTGRTDCCGSGASGACNIYGFLDDALTRTGNFSRVKGGTSSFQQVENEIVAGRPHGIRVAWSGGGAHFVCATGVQDNDFVWVSDCGSGTTSLVNYDTLVNSYSGSGSWTHSYFTQA